MRRKEAPAWTSLGTLLQPASGTACDTGVTQCPPQSPVLLYSRENCTEAAFCRLHLEGAAG